MKSDVGRDELQRRVISLERRVTLFNVCTVIMVLIIISMVAGNVTQALPETGQKEQVIRARGLVIVDDKGRERILIGAPIPQARNRVRTDLERVKKVWASGFPAGYIDWYKNYRHDLDGMLVLDEDGFDRVAVGDRLLDANIGRRISSNMTGIIVNQEKGQERGGYGVLKVNDKNRVILTMDSVTGQEGLGLSLHDGGGIGFEVNQGRQRLFLGNAPPGDHKTAGLAESFQGLLIRDGDEIKHKINVAEKK